MQIHKSPGVLLDLPRIHEHLGEAQAVADVCGAAPPLPSLLLVVETLLVLVAVAAAQAPTRAGRGDCMCNPCSDDSVGESSFLTACGGEKKLLQSHEQTTGFRPAGAVRPPHIFGIADLKQIVKHKSMH